ncbi:MAG: SMC-Scp complex subunit ScpB [Tagaea sp.]|nr:SMC-Scp complex subunit ScpB [Tagaea sp.]
MSNNIALATAPDFPAEAAEAVDAPVAPEPETVVAPELPPEELKAQALRVIEAMIFASSEALSVKDIAKRLPKGVDVPVLIDELEAHYHGRGVNLVRVAGKLAFRTAPDVADKLKIERVVARKLSRAATETLAIVAYQTADGKPVTRAEIEEIRGVALSKGTLEILMEAEFVQPKGHRETPGRPVTYAVTDKFLEHFGLDGIKALPGVKELRELGLLDTRPAVSAYNEEGGLAPKAEMGEAAEAEEGPIDEREIEPVAEEAAAEAPELEVEEDLDDESEFEDDDGDDDDEEDETAEDGASAVDADDDEHGDEPRKKAE